MRYKSKELFLTAKGNSLKSLQIAIRQQKNG
jgi:hypothetical protein